MNSYKSLHWVINTAANFTSDNKIFPDTWRCLESDTGLQKQPDGTTAWTDLAYDPQGSANNVRVRAATTANITISTALGLAAGSLDGVTLATGDYVLVKNQTSASANGIYVVGATPARAAAFNTYNEHPGSIVTVAEGTVNADRVFLCTSNAGGTLDTTGITYSDFGLVVGAGFTSTATAAGTTTLTVASTEIQEFTGVTTQTITLPVVTTLPRTGWKYHIINNSTGALTVNSSGANLVQTIPAGAEAIITCVLLTGTTAASWRPSFITKATSAGALDTPVLIAPNGTSSTGVMITKMATFTENATNTTHTGTIAIPAGAILHNIQVNNSVLWAAGAAVMKVGDTADDDGYFVGIDLKATDLLVGEVLDTSPSTSWGGKEGAYLVAATGRRGPTSSNFGKYYAAGSNIVGVVTVTTPGSTAGRTQMIVTYSVGEVVAAVASGS